MKKYVPYLVLFHAVLFAYLLTANGCSAVRDPVPDPSSPVADTAWPSFRGDPAMTGTSPVDFSMEPALAWTFEAGSAVTATAAIAGDRIYVATEGGRLTALRGADGVPLWTFEADAPISASPCIIGDAILVGDGNGVFYAIDLEGTERWRFATEAQITSSATPGPDNSVLFGSYDHRLYALDVADGTLRWAFETRAQVHCAPCIADGMVFIAGCDGKVRGIDALTGLQRMEGDADSNFSAGPAWVDGMLYVGSMTGELLEVDGRDGRLIKLPVEEDAGPVYAQAAVSEDTVVFATRGRYVVAMDRGEVSPRWTYRTRDRVDASPVIAGQAVLVGSMDGQLHAIDLARGTRLWGFDAGAAISASPAIGSGLLVIGAADGAVYAFKAPPIPAK